MKSLPDYHEFQIYTKTPLKSLFTAASKDALDLLEKMLVFDPLKRITAEDVSVAGGEIGGSECALACMCEKVD